MEGAPSRYSEFRRGWGIVLASLLGIGLGLSPLPFYTMGMFAPHLAREFGWSMSEIMVGLSIQTAVILFAAPVIGVLATRYGVRRVAICSLVLFSVSFMSLGLSNGSLTLYYATWALLALLGTGTLPITWTRVVNQWFDTSRGLALGLSMTGSGLFGIFSKPYVTWLIEQYGWRAAYIGLGALPLAIAVPVAFILLRDTDTDTDSGKHAILEKPKSGGLTLKEASTHWRFWLLAFSLIAISFALGGPVPHMENILTQGGLDPHQILRVTPLLGLCALIGRIAGGWLLDRFWAPLVAFVIVSLPSASCLLLAAGPLDPGSAALAVCLLGFALGIEYDFIAYFVSRYFGLKNYAVIYSFMYVFFCIGAGFSPMVFGWDFDAQGNYARILSISAIVLIVGASAFLFLGRYRHFPDEDAGAMVKSD